MEITLSIRNNLDIDAPDGPGADIPVNLTLGWGGLGSGGVPVDNNQPIWIDATVVGKGNFMNDEIGRPACNWQKYEVHATYHDVYGQYYYNTPLGFIWLAHSYKWNYSVGSETSANTSIPNPNGSGTIFYVNQLPVAWTYPDGDIYSSSSGGCSDGGHTHIEFLSKHNWGKELEYHGAIPPESYQGLLGYTDHIHWDTWSDYDTTYASRTLGWLGGNTTTFWMADNPWSGTH